MLNTFVSKMELFDLIGSPKKVRVDFRESEDFPSLKEGDVGNANEEGSDFGGILRDRMNSQSLPASSKTIKNAAFAGEKGSEEVSQDEKYASSAEKRLGKESDGTAVVIGAAVTSVETPFADNDTFITETPVFCEGKKVSKEKDPGAEGALLSPHVDLRKAEIPFSSNGQSGSYSSTATGDAVPENEDRLLRFVNGNLPVRSEFARKDAEPAKKFSAVDGAESADAEKSAVLALASGYGESHETSRSGNFGLRGLLNDTTGDLPARSEFAWKVVGTAEEFSAVDGTTGAGGEKAAVSTVPGGYGEPHETSRGGNFGLRGLLNDATGDLPARSEFVRKDAEPAEEFLVVDGTAGAGGEEAAVSATAEKVEFLSGSTGEIARDGSAPEKEPVSGRGDFHRSLKFVWKDAGPAEKFGVVDGTAGVVGEAVAALAAADKADFLSGSTGEMAHEGSFPKKEKAGDRTDPYPRLAFPRQDAGAAEIFPSDNGAGGVEHLPVNTREMAGENSAFRNETVSERMAGLPGLMKSESGNFPVRADFVSKDGGAVNRFSIVDGRAGAGGEDADVLAAPSRFEQPSGNTGEEARDPLSLKDEKLPGNGMLKPESVKRDVALAATDAGETDDIFPPMKAVSGDGMKSAAEEPVSHATKPLKGGADLSLLDRPGNGSGHTVSEAAAYNAGRIFFAAGDSVSASSGDLAFQIASQLSEDVLKSSSRVRINLYPESLGSVDLDIVVRENRVHVWISAERGDVVQSLQGQQEQLKNALQSQGLQVGSLDFQWRENSAAMGDGSGGRNLWRRQDQESGPREEKNHEVPVVMGRLGALDGATLPFQAGERAISLFV